MTAWVGEAPRYFLLLGIFYLPGLAFSHVFHRHQPTILRVGIAPAWSVGTAVILATIYEFTGIRWNVWTYATGMFVLLGVAALLFATLRRWRVQQVIDGAPQALPLIVTAIVLGAVAILPILSSIPPDGIIQGGDSQFHTNLLWKLEQDGVASPLVASRGMGGLDTPAGFYPTAWHTMLALATSGPTEVLVSTNMMLLVKPVIWLFSMAALTFSVTLSRSATWASFPTSTLVPFALIRLELVTTLWPFVYGMAIMLGALAMVISELRLIPRRSAFSKMLAIGSLVIPAIGILTTHPSAFLPGTLTAWVVGIAWTGKRILHTIFRRSEWLRAGIWTACFVLLVLSPQIAYMSKYAEWFQLHRPSPASFETGLPVIKYALTMYPSWGPRESFNLYVGLTVIVLAAAATVWVHGQRWLIYAWGAQVVLLVACYVPLPVFSHLTSIYYHVPARALVGESVFLIPLLASALSLWYKWWAKTIAFLKSRGVIGAAMLLIIGLAMLISFPANYQSSHEMVYPSVQNDRFLAGPGEISMIRRAANTLPTDAYVIGDPAVGTALLQMTSNRRVVWPYPGRERGQEDVFLAEHFKDIHVDPRICEVVRKHQITHFYKDRAGWYNSNYNPDRRPGLYEVDTSKGFTLVDRAGPAQIFSIDICYDQVGREE